MAAKRENIESTEDDPRAVKIGSEARMRTQRVLRIFLASPSDVAPEREVVVEIASELNLIWGDYVGVRLDVLRWETHVIPAIGTDAQSIVSDQIGIDYDLLLGILWSRLGTPTPRYPSGTVEEIRSAIAAYRVARASPQVMIYLKALPTDGTSADAENILRFIAELQTEGLLVWRFRTTDDFRYATRIHLSRFIQRSVALHEMGHPTTYAAPPESLTRVLDTLPGTLDDALTSSAAGIASASRIVGLVERYSDQMNATSAALNRWQQPGFRKRPGGWKAIIRPFTQQMEQFAAEFAAETRTVFGHYSSFVAGLGRTLSVTAPLRPLPPALRTPLAGNLTQVATMRAALTKMRNNEAEFREVLAGWCRLEPSFDAAKRLALDALDDFDVQATSALQLTRELERTIEEFLDA